MEIDSYFESSVFNADNLTAFVSNFAEKYPLEFVIFVEYAGQVSLPHYASDNFYPRYVQAWRDFGPYLNARSLDLISDGMKALEVKLYGPQNLLGPMAKALGMSKSAVELIGAVGKARKIVRGGNVIDMTAEAMQIWGSGQPQVINEALFRRIHGRGYD